MHARYDVVEWSKARHDEPAQVASLECHFDQKTVQALALMQLLTFEAGWHTCREADPSAADNPALDENEEGAADEDKAASEAAQSGARLLLSCRKLPGGCSSSPF